MATWTIPNGDGTEWVMDYEDYRKYGFEKKRARLKKTADLKKSENMGENK